MVSSGPTTVLPPPCLSAAMAPRIDDVMRLCCELSAHDQIKVAVKSSAKGAAVAGGSAFVGGLLGGPAGIAVGEDWDRGGVRKGYIFT